MTLISEIPNLDETVLKLLGSSVDKHLLLSNYLIQINSELVSIDLLEYITNIL